ncbi:hypothetical protein [Chondromyces crocatus]|uniref:Uncharacterized protein n=1 Tax=Chondromyces crocatus TaxID=52 RepID=A0A0K1EFQ1_CHOCO|nr:hypothetical protein [Chondromyces crocatus]AKT39522.1 uncharacterized protein CMC5_036690 [Chondromyces crocatus]
MNVRAIASIAFVAVTCGVGCSEKTVDGANTAGAGASSGTSGDGGAGLNGAGGAGGLLPSGAGGAGASTSGVGGAPTEISPCQNQIYECGDLIDNDGDGLIDSQDPDCLGPCDNTEGSYYGGIPGQAGPPCIVDCYWDSNSGAGNDACYWSHRCDPNEVAPSYYPEPENGATCAYDPTTIYPGSGMNCAALEQSQSQQCHEVCGPLTPNGCDCFGCCELPAGSGKFIWLGSEGVDGNTVCTADAIDDPTRCHPCKPVPSCLNSCGPCEVCVGKPAPDPGCPPSSGSGGGGGNGTQQCESGVQPCGLAGQDHCPPFHYCITGCCRPVPQ